MIDRSKIKYLFNNNQSLCDIDDIPCYVDNEAESIDLIEFDIVLNKLDKFKDTELSYTTDEALIDTVNDYNESVKIYKWDKLNNSFLEYLRIKTQMDNNYYIVFSDGDEFLVFIIITDILI